MKRITKQILCNAAVQYYLTAYADTQHPDCRRIFHYFDSCGPNAPWQQLEPFFAKHLSPDWLKLMCSACGQEVDEAIDLEVDNTDYEEEREVHICQSCLTAALQTLGTASQPISQ